MSKDLPYKIKLPSYSQYLDVTDPSWQPRACGIVATKMAANIDLPADELIKVGLDVDAYQPGAGWKHQGLANIACEFGCPAEACDWHELDTESAWQEISDLIGKTPIIASIYKDFDPIKGGGHLIVLTGFEKDKVFFKDPEARDRQAIDREISLENFLIGWKKRAIIFSPEA